MTGVKSPQLFQVDVRIGNRKPERYDVRATSETDAAGRGIQELLSDMYDGRKQRFPLGAAITTDVKPIAV